LGKVKVEPLRYLKEIIKKTPSSGYHMLYYGRILGAYAEER